MPTGLEIFGAVSGSVALAIQIHDFFQNQSQDQEAGALILSIRHDSAVLRDFAEIFDAAAKDNAISIYDKLLLNEVCVALQPALIAIHGWIVRRQLAQLTARPAWILADKISGFLFKHAELQKVATELFQWTERYHIRLGLLPPRLKQKLLGGPNQDESRASISLRALRDTFSRLTTQSDLIPESELRKAEQEVVVRPGATSSRMVANIGRETVIIEFKGHNTTLGGQALDVFRAEVVNLLKRLSCANTSLCRILKGVGYYYQPSLFQFAFLYQIPSNVYIEPNAASPTTLMDLIKATRRSQRDPNALERLPPLHALDQRFDFARKIACAVLYVHVMGWVHKSIRTSNIVVFPKKSTPPSPTRQFPKHLGEPFLCGFETARHDKATSDQQGDAHWHYNIYRHPKRQGLHPEERYSMNHDIYGLGVVLLELGMWKPLLATGLAALRQSSAEDVRLFLRELAATKLPVSMGTKYCETVLYCLDIDGETQVGSTAVVEEVLGKLEELSIGMH